MGISGLWDWIETHERQCSYRKLTALVEDGSEDNRLKHEKDILEIIRYDRHVRELTVEEGRMNEQMLDFLFGRPLTDTIKMFDIALAKQDGCYRLVTKPSLSCT
jgi:hypothetical protein